MSQALAAKTDASLYVSLAGPIRIWTSDNSRIAVHSDMSKRLIAILLRSNGMRRSRASLQLLLWNDAKADPGSNLRQLIRMTKQRLGDCSGHLVADASSVALQNVEDRTEKVVGCQLDFFEDAGIGTEEFEDWYRIEQSSYQELTPQPRRNESFSQIAPRPLVALTNSRSGDLTSKSEAVEELVSNHLRDVFVWNAIVDFVDARKSDHDLTCDMELRVSTQEIEKQVEVSVGGFMNGVCRWSQSAIFSAQEDLGAQRQKITEFAYKVGAFIEQTVCRFTQTPVGNENQIQFFDTITNLFSMRPEALTLAGIQLDSFHKFDGEPRLLAWRAFARILQTEEMLVDNPSETINDAEKLISDALDKDPFDLSSLSVGACYHSLIRRDFDQGRHYSDTALDLAPFSPFALDIRSKIEMFDGQIEEAERLSSLALRMGKYSPARHYLAGTEIFVAFLLANHQKVVALARGLLRLKPQYLSVLRHVVPSLLELNEYEEARKRIADVQKIDPSYATSRMFEQSFALPSRRARDMMREIFIRHGVLEGI